jgi:quinol monooxygenase YgiN
MIHAAILRRVREGREAEFEAIIARFFREAKSDPATTGAYLLRPASDANPREYGILRSFPSEADMNAFYDSPRFRKLEEDLAPLMEGEARRRAGRWRSSPGSASFPWSTRSAWLSAS